MLSCNKITVKVVSRALGGVAWRLRSAQLGVAHVGHFHERWRYSPRKRLERLAICYHIYCIY